MSRAGIFLDKDGCIVDDSGYPFRIPKTTLMKGAEEALIKLAQVSLPIIVVSNQAWIAKGRLTMKEAEEIFAELTDKVRKFGGRIDGTYFCPHAPKDRCFCRKPEIGMLERASREHDIDLMSSWLIGDMMTDIWCGAKAEVACTVLLKSGKHLENNGPQPTHIFEDLLEAVNALF